MYILLEMASASGGTQMWNWDCMGYTKTEQQAMRWVADNPSYRTYKYCPNKEIK